jgi:HEAT repeat protein
VVSDAVILLGQVPDSRAAEILVRALVEGRTTRSRIAASLDAFPIDVSEHLVPMLASVEPAVRYWGAMLMRRYAANPGVGSEIGRLTADPEPLVRRAAVETMAAVGGAMATAAARALLADAIPFVKAHAARTLGVLNAREAVEDILPLLADRDWWVRYAAKESLEAMGLEIMDAVVPYLAHPDTFARNGAAEVLQNVGAFERLLVLEASAQPDPARHSTLALLARAGGRPMWDSVLTRLDKASQTRARQVLANIDLNASRSSQLEA